MSSANVPIDKISKGLQTRFDNTLKFMESSDFKPKKILDLGPDNTFAQILREKGYEVVNTGLVDLDTNPEILRDFQDVDCVTSFEFFEHLVSPFTVLQELPKVKMFITVPLRLWFSTAFRNINDPWDQHFHEFEDWQFDWLLDKAGWEIERTEKWIAKTGTILGFRPILRRFTPRYYALEVSPKTEK